MTKTLHELAKEMLNKANVEVLTETGKLKKEEPAKVVEEGSIHRSSLSAALSRVPKSHPELRKGKNTPADKGIAAAKKDDEARDVKEDELDESTRKHFQQVADVIKSHPDAAKRKELAQHHSEIFAKQNPRFDKKKFHAASNAELDEGVNGEHGPDDDEDQLDRIERKKQKEPPFTPDKKKSTNWTSAKNKAKNLARAAMKKQVEKKKVNEEGYEPHKDSGYKYSKQNLADPDYHAKQLAARKAAKKNVKAVKEDKIKPDSKIKVGGKYVFGNTKGNVAHIEGDKTKKLTTEMDLDRVPDDHGSEEGYRNKLKREAKLRAKEALGKRKKEPYLPFGKALPRHRIGQNHMTEMELAELSKETLQKYRDTSSLEIGKAKAKKAWAQHDAKRDPSPENYQKHNDAEHAIQKRTKGQELVKKKLGEDEINELSRKTLGSYKRKALEYIGNHHERGKKNKKVSNKVTGIDRAQNRLLSK